jgi:hypothetical protein
MHTEVDAEGNGRVRVVPREPVPHTLGLDLGEFPYQVRASLDNCLYAVAVIDSGQNPPPQA